MNSFTIYPLNVGITYYRRAYTVVYAAIITDELLPFIRVAETDSYYLTNGEKSV